MPTKKRWRVLCPRPLNRAGEMHPSGDEFDITERYPGLHHAPGSRVHADQEDVASPRSVTFQVGPMRLPGILQRVIDVAHRRFEAKIIEFFAQPQNGSNQIQAGPPELHAKRELGRERVGLVWRAALRARGPAVTFALNPIGNAADGCHRYSRNGSRSSSQDTSSGTVLRSSSSGSAAGSSTQARNSSLPLIKSIASRSYSYS